MLELSDSENSGNNSADQDNVVAPVEPENDVNPTKIQSTDVVDTTTTDNDIPSDGVVVKSKFPEPTGELTRKKGKNWRRSEK